MNKLKRIGISALAGSLVSLSAAQAGGVTVGGTAEITYTTLDQESVTGNRVGTKKNISFSGGGEFANGWTYGILHVMNDGMSGISSSSMNINMGGIATLAYDAGTGGYGANAVDNIVPIAWEEIDYGLSAGITDVGQVSKTIGVVNFTVKAPGSGTLLSLSYAARMGTDHVADGGTSGPDDAGPGDKGVDVVLDLVNIDASWFGWRLGSAAEFVSHPASCKHIDSNNDATVQGACATSLQAEDEWGGTAYTSLRLGPFSAGYQQSFIDNGSAASSGVAYNRSWVFGTALTIGNYLSFSYGIGEDQKRYNDKKRNLSSRQHVKSYSKDNTFEKITSYYEGGSVAGNWGPLSLKYVINTVSNRSMHTDRLRDQHQEINLSMAF